MTQTQLAHALDLRHASISDYERGEATPDPERIVQLADALGVTVGWLMRGEESQPPAPLGDTPEYRAFLATPLGQSMTTEERLLLASVSAPGVTISTLTYQVMLAALRGTR
jgi:transcriptional regulator with XRE-family HTH domain